MADVLPSFEVGFAYSVGGEVTSTNLKQLVENAAPRPNLIAQRTDYSPSTEGQLAPDSAQVLLLDDDRIFKSSGDAWLNLRSDFAEKRLSLGKDSGQTGLYNVFVGQASGQHVTGNSNTSIGSAALSQATTASENTAVGSDALFNHQGDDLLRNTAVGYQALAGNKPDANTWNAHNNVAVGVKAARELIRGDYNVAVGNAAMEFGDETEHCVAIGNQSLWKSTTGSQSIAVGTGALQEATNPSNSIALGVDALKNSVDPSSNIAIGGHAGSGCTSNQNVLIGTEAGKFLTSGSNIAIGWKAMSSTQENVLANCITVGASAVATRSNQVALGGTQTHVKLPVLPSGATAVAQLVAGELYTLDGVVKQVQP